MQALTLARSKPKEQLYQMSFLRCQIRRGLPAFTHHSANMMEMQVWLGLWRSHNMEFQNLFCSVCWGTIRDQHSYWWGESRRKWSALTWSKGRRLRWWTQGAPALCFVTMVDMLVAETPRAKSSWGILTPSLCNIPWILIQVGILPSCASNKPHL